LFKPKTLSTTIALILMLTIAIPFVAIPIASSQLSTRPTYAYIGAVPNPVGVGQEVLIHVGITQPLENYWMGWEGLTITVTKPDGTKETLGPFRTDSTGGTGTVFVPTMMGNYTFQTHMPEQITTETNYGGGTPANVTMLASDSRVLTLVVEEQLKPIWPGLPLPTEYWTRPIDSQLREWNTISASWVSTPENFVARNNDNAPETAHILWEKQLAMGGLAGGVEFGPQSMEIGDAYEGKFQSSVIIGGILYYNRFNTEGRFLPQQAQTVVAVDLHTGEELWNKPLLDLNGRSQNLAFGQVFYWDSFNYHGVFTYLWTTVGSTWNAYDAFTGEWSFSVTGVPSGSTIRDEKGNLYRLNVDTVNDKIRLWNLSRTIQPQSTGGSADGSWGRQIGRESAYSNRTYPAARGIEWEKTIPDLSGSVYLQKFGDSVVGYNLYGPNMYMYRSDHIGVTQINIWGLSLKSGQEGTLLFNKTTAAPADWATGQLRIVSTAGSIDDDLIVFRNTDTSQFWGFSAKNGQFLWGPTAPQDYLDVFALRSFITDGKFFSLGMSGILHSYDAKTGNLLWTYMADDPFNQVLWANQWHIRPLFIADGKIYMGTTEHSPVDPRPRGSPFVCVDIETGEEVFRADGLFRQTDWGGRAIIGDSIIATMDTYDQRIYAISKGPSASIVTASSKVSVFGSSVVFEGMVTDVSPGTKSSDLSMRFPNGVPAVSDESMSDWMLYVYKQFPRPSNVTGVDVTIDVLDSNGNYRNIGTATSDSSGKYGFSWTPDISGDYTVIATFAGSKSYYPSYDVTYLTVDEAPDSTPQQTPHSVSVADVYFVPAIAALFIAIIIVGALMMLMLRKRP
jgi:hypothetical protein